jgi:hypothetical protein
LFKAAALLALVVLAGRWVWRALAPDETKIRWVCEDMLDGFNEMRTARVARGLAPDFRDESSGLTREEVREVCRYAFLNELDPKDKSFAYRAEFVPEVWKVKVAEGTPKRATATLGARFFDKRGGKERLFWEARVEGEFALGDEGWQWTRTTSVNHSDRRLH